jgi:hypothetical protein
MENHSKVHQKSGHLEKSRFVLRNQNEKGSIRERVRDTIEGIGEALLAQKAKQAIALFIKLRASPFRCLVLFDSFEPIPCYMLQSYLLIVRRSLLRHPGTALINLLGLVIGTAAGLLLHYAM